MRVDDVWLEILLRAPTARTKSDPKNPTSASLALHDDATSLAMLPVYASFSYFRRRVTESLDGDAVDLAFSRNTFGSGSNDVNVDVFVAKSDCETEKKRSGRVFRESRKRVG